MARTTLDSNSAGLKTRAGKYLTFTLGQEAYGVPVLKVREIIRLVHITPVPQMPAHVGGLVSRTVYPKLETGEVRRKTSGRNEETILFKG